MPRGNICPDAAVCERDMAFTHERALGEADVAIVDARMAVPADLYAIRAVMHAALVHDELSADSGDS